ncbi:MAG: hypothetical protein ACR2I2_08120, partial [Bryobacteraceae bacterium]
GYPLAPLIGLRRHPLLNDRFSHETTMQPDQPFGKRGSSDAYDFANKNAVAIFLRISGVLSSVLATVSVQ